MYTLHTFELTENALKKKNNQTTTTHNNVSCPIVPGTFVHRFIPLRLLKWLTHTGNLWHNCFRLNVNGISCPIMVWSCPSYYYKNSFSSLLSLSISFSCLPSSANISCELALSVLLISLSVLFFPPYFCPFPR